MIREKAKMARAESYITHDIENGELGTDELQSDDLIGPENEMTSCDSSGNSSTGLMLDHSNTEIYPPVRTYSVHTYTFRTDKSVLFGRCCQFRGVLALPMIIGAWLMACVLMAVD